MQVLVDADACPVTDLALRMAKAHGADVTLFCDDAHLMRRTDVQIVTVMRGADSADFALVNRCRGGDIVITQDYALAAMALAKGAAALHPSGMIYTDENITGLLSMRHVTRKARRAGKHLRGPKARTKEMDDAFERAFATLLGRMVDSAENGIE